MWILLFFKITVLCIGSLIWLLYSIKGCNFIIINPNEPRIKTMLKKSHKSEFLSSHLAFFICIVLIAKKKYFCHHRSLDDVWLMILEKFHHALISAVWWRTKTVTVASSFTRCYNSFPFGWFWNSCCNVPWWSYNGWWSQSVLLQSQLYRRYLCTNSIFFYIHLFCSLPRNPS